MLLQKFQSLWLISNRNLSKNFILFKHKQIPWMPLSADTGAGTLHSDFTQTLLRQELFCCRFCFSAETKHNIAVNTCDTLNKNPRSFQNENFLPRYKIHANESKSSENKSHNSSCQQNSQNYNAGNKKNGLCFLWFQFFNRRWVYIFIFR